MAAAFLTVQLVVLAASILLWMQRYWAKQQSGVLLALRPHEVSPIGIIDIAATVFIWLVLQLVGMIPVKLFMDLDISDLDKVGEFSAQQMLEFGGWMMLMQLAATLFAIIWFLIRHRKVEWLGTAKGLNNDIKVGLAASLMVIPMVMVIQLVVTQLIPYTHPTLDSLAENFTTKAAVWAWVAAVGVAPLAEEFFFRGIIQGWLQRAMDHDEPKEKWFIGGKLEPLPKAEFVNVPKFLENYRFWAPIVITSFVFAGVHLGQGPAPIPLFFLSLGLGYVFRKTGSFVPCVIVHLALNSLSMIILTLSLIYPELAPSDPEPATGFILK